MKHQNRKKLIRSDPNSEFTVEKRTSLQIRHCRGETRQRNAIEMLCQFERGCANHRELMTDYTTMMMKPPACESNVFTVFSANNACAFLKRISRFVCWPRDPDPIWCDPMGNCGCVFFSKIVRI